MTNESEIFNEDEIEALREVLAEFKQSVNSGSWEKAIQAEAKKRVQARRQAALRDDYDAEVASLQHVEERLRLRDKYRKLGLNI